MKNLYFYPSAPKGGYRNPYSVLYKSELQNYFSVLDKDNKPSGMKSLWFFFYSFKADVFIINWLDSVCFLKFAYIQFCLAYLSLCIIKFRKKKIVWMVHNIHPHEGFNWMSEKINLCLAQKADIIITHSNSAKLYIEEKYKKNVIYRCHPFVDALDSNSNEEVCKSIDFLIWGDIFPYKGIVEFLTMEYIIKSNFKIRIIGRCKNLALLNKITQLSDKDNVMYENRRVGYEELKSLVQKSKYVVFPYVGDCVSSSGTLMDTIYYGGNPIGPNVGAFKDLSEEKMCLVYSNEKEFIDIIERAEIIDYDVRKKFITNNTWNSFVKYVSTLICYGQK